MPRFRSFALGLTLVVAGGFAPALIPAATTACAAAADGDAHAGLVVGTGQRTTTYCVALDAQMVSGIHLIELAGEQFGLQYRLGFGGKAVCQLDGVGPDGDNCFGDYPYYWGYWHWDGANGWTWSGSGAGSSSIGDGAMDGWTWGTGDSGSTHPPPPPMTFGDVCAGPSPSPSPSPSPTPKPSPSASPTRPRGGGGGPTSNAPTTLHSPTGSAGSVAEGGATTVGTTTGSGVSSGPVAPSSTAGGIVQAAAVANSPPGGGPPAGAFLAIAAALALGLAGTLRLRSGRRADPPPRDGEDP